MKKLIIWTVLILNAFCSYSQIDTTRGTISKIVTDSLLISTKDSIYVKAEVDRLKFYKGTGCEYCESSDISLTIKDYQGNVLLKQNYLAFFDSWDYIGIYSIYLEGIGNVLVFHESHFPTVGSDEGNVTLFGQNSYGYLIQMSGNIHMSGKFSDKSLFKVHKINKDRQLVKDCDNCKYCLETVNFTGMCGFNVGEFYPFNKEGEFESKSIELDTIPIYAGNSNYTTIKELNEDLADRIVTLYQKPDLNSPQRKITLKINSIVKFNYIIRNFIYLRIDGFEGYINDYSELNKLGFPSCD